MDGGGGTQEWGTVAPAGDRGQPSLLINEGWAGVSGPSTLSVWRPPGDLGGELPEGFGLPVRCHVGPDGRRRFAPIGSFEGFVAGAWMGGFALLCRRRQLDAEQRQGYRLMWLLFQRVRGMREHYRRSFAWHDDFAVCKSGRPSPRELSVIPAVVKDRTGEPGPPPVSYLRAKGLEAARAAGIAEPSREQVFHHGLVALAREVPLSKPDDRVPELIRSALFDGGSAGQGLAPAFLENVFERVRDALLAHTTDTAAKFDGWFLDRKNSFFKLIAQQRRKPGGQLDRQQVRRAVLRYGWDAYQYVADCVSMQMQAVARSLPEPLTPGERGIFEEMHLRRPHYGGLPLALLGERIGFVESVVRELCENPGDRRPVGVLHRLLQYYADMAPARRAADRRRKGRGVLALDEQRVARSPSGPDRFSEIAARILAVKGESCDCADPEWVAQSGESDEEEVSFEAHYVRCGAYRDLTLPRAEFASLGLEIIRPAD